MADAKVTISLHNLYVEIAQDSAYPDQMSDMSNRALMLFMSALTAAKDSGIDISDLGMDLETAGDDEDDD